MIRSPKNRRKSVYPKGRPARRRTTSNRRLSKMELAGRMARLKAIRRAIGRAVRVVTVGIVLGGVVSGVAVGGYLAWQRVLISGHFRVNTVEIHGLDRASEAEISRILAGVKGKQIYDVDPNVVEAALRDHPWIKSALVEKMWPRRMRATITEHIPQATVLLGSLYLVNQHGEVFKRALAFEADGLPTITGIDRSIYLEKKNVAKAKIRHAFDLIKHYRRGQRPDLSEIHVGVHQEVTLFLRDGGAALHFGKEMSDARLAKFDAVMLALGPQRRKASAFYLDNEVRRDRVVVRMATKE